MIKLDVDDYCNDCPDFDAEVNKIFCGCNVVETIIQCSNKSKCDSIARYYEKRFISEQEE